MLNMNLRNRDATKTIYIPPAGRQAASALCVRIFLGNSFKPDKTKISWQTKSSYRKRKKIFVLINFRKARYMMIEIASRIASVNDNFIFPFHVEHILSPFVFHRNLLRFCPCLTFIVDSFTSF